MSRRVARTSLAVGGALVAAACGGTSHPAAPVVHVASGSIAPAPAPSAARGALAALTDLRCQAGADGVWSAHGTVTNHGSTTLDYVVVLDVVSAADGSVRARADADYRLRPGQSATVDVPHLYAGAASGLRCVPNVRAAGG